MRMKNINHYLLRMIVCLENVGDKSIFYASITAWDKLIYFCQRHFDRNIGQEIVFCRFAASLMMINILSYQV